MNTDAFPAFCDSLPYLIYILKVIAENSSLSRGKTLHLLPLSATISTEKSDLAASLCNIVKTVQQRRITENIEYILILLNSWMKVIKLYLL
jgi:hypothetical protein